MHHLILGYGYCGYYLAQELLNNGQHVTAISRHLDKEFELPNLKHIEYDLSQPFHWSIPGTVIYYLIPPPSIGKTDVFLAELLQHNTIAADKVIYFGSSGVYGNHDGSWVDEDSPCHISSDRQLRRLDAEKQWQDYCMQHRMELVLLRIAGIYGPGQLPVEAAKAKTPLIELDKAPFTNHIYVKNLVSIACLLAQMKSLSDVFNIADGDPSPMGTLQREVAKCMGLQAAPYESWSEAWERASHMKREFMQGSKRLSVEKLQKCLGNDLKLTPLTEAIKECLGLVV